jgi:hypothetical protein
MATRSSISSGSHASGLKAISRRGLEVDDRDGARGVSSTMSKH